MHKVGWKYQFSGKTHSFPLQLQNIGLKMDSMGALESPLSRHSHRLWNHPVIRLWLISFFRSAATATWKTTGR